MDEQEIVLTQLTIYDKPVDHPMMFVVREWHICRGGAGPVAGKAWAVPTLERARALVPDGMVCIGRQDDDDPVIVETWT